MFEILRTSQFKRDVKKVKKRGKDTDRLKTVIGLLAHGRTLPAKYKDHQLKGVYKDCRECHVEPDWLLIYRVEANILQLIRTGSHSDLFT
ncbi:MAG: type II toxin-antitoxin system YafQ family toxin [Verrucomicrobia bacterium]|jgi:mRNA interferase YafQ|nr:type II toxin-antitoxin system YafQ family toxin [Verrucomicrobiota bacterium]